MPAGAAICKHCSSRLAIEVIKPEFEGDVILKTLPVRTCPKCDVGAPPSKLPWRKPLQLPPEDTA